jgi:hypothetical protein
MDPKRASLLRQLPQVDDLLRHPHLSPAVAARSIHPLELISAIQCPYVI